MLIKFFYVKDRVGVCCFLLPFPLKAFTVCHSSWTPMTASKHRCWTLLVLSVIVPIPFANAEAFPLPMPKPRQSDHFLLACSSSEEGVSSHE